MSGYLRLAVLLSGNGRTLANLIQCWDQGRLLGKVELVVSSRPDARGLTVAADAGISTAVIDSHHYRRSAREGEETPDWFAMSEAINNVLGKTKWDLVCMAGFCCRYYFPDSLQGRILNIHPSLIPMFCGQGMYGFRVHEAVITSGVRVTGCTVHFVDHMYDHGSIILQRCCPVYSGDIPEDVAERVFVEECAAYPTAINLIAGGRVHYLSGLPAYVDDDHAIERFGANDA
jgi:formyltetrahydrofolate-dependent phosphoribosylglycinamide formyltransferase